MTADKPAIYGLTSASNGFTASCAQLTPSRSTFHDIFLPRRAKTPRASGWHCRLGAGKLTTPPCKPTSTRLGHQAAPFSFISKSAHQPNYA